MRSAAIGVLALCAAASASATEGALGRPVAGTSVQPDAGIVPDIPLWIVNLQSAFVDGSIGGSRAAPIGGRAAVDLDAKLSLTLATLLRTWGSYGGWSFASGFTLPYIWNEVSANASIGGLSRTTGDRSSNLYDLYFTPIMAGYHLTKTDHIALSFSFWAPTGHYDPAALSNAGLNVWTFVPQVSYTKLVPKYGLEFDVTFGLQFYTRNGATDYQNAPLLTLDAMVLKKLHNGFGFGIAMGTVQQLGHDSGPLANRLDGFVGHDFALGPVVTYETKIGGKRPFSASLRWVPSIASSARLKSTSSFLATATVAF